MDDNEEDESQKSEESLKPELIEEVVVIEEIPEEEEEKPKIQLDEVCNMENLVDLKARFDEALWNVLDRDRLRKCLKEVIGVEFDDEEFNIIFLKINSNRNGVVNWDEFVSYLLLCLAAKDSFELKFEAGGLVPPISKKPKILKSHHPHAINRICFSPNVDKHSWGNPIQGSYVTLSPEGVVNRWTLDMELIRTTWADCALKRDTKARPTLVSACCMPDVNILVVSTSLNELYFYDTTAGCMTARVIVVRMKHVVEALYFHSDSMWHLMKSYRSGGIMGPPVNAESCFLVAGDNGGNVFVMTFSTWNLGPFQKRMGKSLTKLSFRNLVKGKLSGMTVREFYSVHSAPVRQVSYYSSLSCIISCSDCSIPLSMYSLTSSNSSNVFHITKGVVCFTFDEDKHSLATGSSDGTVCFWSIFVPTRPSNIFKGHHASIVMVILQSKSTKLYSLDAARVIKVWSIRDQSCLQTFSDLPATIGERTVLAAVYNPANRNLILASLQLAIIECEPKLNELHTDGFTHANSVSVVLYNALFKTVVTCGADSIIICWDIPTGVRQTTIHEAHKRVFNGETIPVEITAATFDPGYQLLLTGARDGTLKTWNFNTGSCLKNMSIEYMNEVTYVLWISNRILAVGWNKHITEFDDTSIKAGDTGKIWETRHTDDVSGAALRSTEVLGTISFGGELVLWKLDTGRAVRQYLCQDPTVRVKIQYSKRSTKKLGSPSSRSQDAFGQRRRKGEPPNMPQMIQQTSCHAIVFLSTRAINAETGNAGMSSWDRKEAFELGNGKINIYSTLANFFIALGDGTVQVWSEHAAGGYLGSFIAVHTEGDYISCLATDASNKYIFSGSATGYIKVWLMEGYMMSEQVHICMPLLRLQFPFLWRDRVEGRAKRFCRKQPLPLLCNSYRAHLRSISSLIHIPEKNYVLSGSADSSVRISTLGGQYLGTLGSFLPWDLQPRKPPDVKKVASSTTLKVLNGGEVSRYVPIRGRSKLEITMSDFKLLKTIDDKLPSDYLLTRICRLPAHPPSVPTIILNDSLAHIPIYTHLSTPGAKPLPNRSRSPPTIRAVRQRKEATGQKKQLTFTMEHVTDVKRSGFSFYKESSSH